MLVGGPVALTAALLESQIGDSSRDPRFPDVVESTRQDLREIWAQGKYWPEKLGVPITVWINIALQLMDSASVDFLWPMARDPESFYLNSTDVEALEAYALGFPLDTDETQRSDLTDGQMLDCHIRRIYERGLKGKGVQEQKQEVIFE